MTPGRKRPSSTLLLEESRGAVAEAGPITTVSALVASAGAAQWEQNRASAGTGCEQLGQLRIFRSVVENEAAGCLSREHFAANHHQKAESRNHQQDGAWLGDAQVEAPTHAVVHGEVALRDRSSIVGNEGDARKERDGSE